MFSKCKSDFEDIQYRVADFKESERCASDFEDTKDITVNSGSLHPQEKQSGNKNKEIYNHQVNPWDNNEANMSTGENASDGIA